MPPGDRLTVLYDADCGVCTMTARMLHALDRGRRLDLSPLQGFTPEAPGDPVRADLAERLHVRDASGRWASGGGAVLRIMAAVPILAPLSMLGRLPGAGRAVDAGYRWVAAHRDGVGRRLGVDRCRIDPARLTD
jgi:predicted DCC family thiol-disulfide oxidoreductase YuxK